MKKFRKNTAIILSVVLSVLLVVGLLFSFVPMNFGNKTWVGLSNSINISSDVVGGVYGEYEIKTEDVLSGDIEKSKTIIKNILSESGYRNASVYDISGEKIRVELSYPKGGTTYQDAITTLQLLTSGKLAFQSESSSSSTSGVKFYASDAIEKVEYTTSSGYMTISIKFNSYGEEQFKTLCNKVSSSQKIYMAFGSNSPQEVNVAQSISSGNYSSLDLTGAIDGYEALFNLKQQIEVGSMPIEFNANTVAIDTMSASLSAGESASSPKYASFFSSSTYIILISTLALIVIATLLAFGVKFGYFAILVFVSMLINSVLFLGIICLIPSVEFGLSALFAMILSIVLVYAFAFDFALSVKREYNNGKSLSAALETSYKSRIVELVLSHSVMFLSSLAFVLLSFGELSSVGVVFAVASFLGLMTNLFIIPFLIKICISFGNFGRHLFMLKKKSISELSETNIEDVNAKEAK